VLTDSADFEVAGHHIADLPVSAGALASSLALYVWDLPLVSASVTLHANLAQFMIAMMQGTATMEAQRHNSLSGPAISASLGATSEAITVARRGVVIAYQHLAALLQAHVNGTTAGAFGQVLGELEAVVQGLTFGDVEGVRTLGLEDFEEWMGLAASDGARLNGVIAGLIDVALAAYL